MKRLDVCAARLSEERGFGLVEALIAVTILVIGLVAVSGLTLASGDQARIAKWRSDQAMAGQLALEATEQLGYGSAVSKVDTFTLGGHDHVVTVTVADVSWRVKQVTAQVVAVGEVGARTFTTRLYRPTPLPKALP